MVVLGDYGCGWCSSSEFDLATGFRRTAAGMTELHWSIGDHDEDEEVVTPCGWCQEPDGDNCRCYVELDEEEYER
jgi:hypothetical protein